jgi:hypothetical protein
MKTLHFRNTLKAFGITLLLLSTLTACSQGKNHANKKTRFTDQFSALQRDFNQHQASAYVKANLNAQPIQKKPLPPSATKVSLNNIKQQLATKKKRATGRIHGAIKHNGLFKPLVAIKQAQLKHNARLPQVLSYAIHHNLDIKSSLQNAQSNLEKYDQVGFLDDMLTQYASFTNDLSLSGSTQKHKKSVNRGFPFPGLLSLKGSIIDQAVNTSRLQLKQTVQDIITQTRIAYYELQFSQSKISISQQTIKLLQALKDELKDSYASNDTGNNAELSGILQTDIEIEKNRNILHIANISQQSSQAKLNALLNLPADFKLGKLSALSPVKLSANTKQLLNSATKHRIEILKLRSELKKMGQIIQLSKKRFYPDFDAGYSRFNSRGSKPGFSQKPKFKNTINNSYFANNDAYLTETKQKYKALQAKINALQTSTENELQQALLAYNSEKSQHRLYQNKVLPKAKATLDIARNLYETGESSFLDIMDAQEMILNYRLLSLKAIKGMNINAARVDRLVGRNF